MPINVHANDYKEFVVEGNNIIPPVDTDAIKIGDKITVEFEVTNVYKQLNTAGKGKPDTFFTVNKAADGKTLSIPADIVVGHKPVGHAARIHQAISNLIKTYIRHSVFDAESPLDGVTLVVSDTVYQAIKTSIIFNNSAPYYNVNMRDYEYAAALPIVVNNAQGFTWSLVRCLDQGK